VCSTYVPLTCGYQEVVRGRVDGSGQAPAHGVAAQLLYSISFYNNGHLAGSHQQFAEFFIINLRNMSVLWIRMFLGLQDPDPLVRGTDPDPSIIKQK
jgi:hypothetical protein